LNRPVTAARTAQCLQLISGASDA